MGTNQCYIRSVPHESRHLSPSVKKSQPCCTKSKPEGGRDMHVRFVPCESRLEGKYAFENNSWPTETRVDLMNERMMWYESSFCTKRLVEGGMYAFFFVRSGSGEARPCVCLEFTRGWHGRESKNVRMLGMNSPQHE